MNPTEQRARQDAVRQLRADMETVLDDYVARVGNDITAYQAMQKRELVKLREDLRRCDAEMLAAAVERAAELSAPIRRGLFGRLRWLVTGY